jgi:preprotein translocase subunit SecG
MGAALGGGAATSAFGGRGAVTFLSKLTAVCAGLFFLTSLGLSFVGVRGSVTASMAAKAAAAKTTPAAPAPAPGSAAPAPATPKASDAEPAPAAPAPAAPAAPAPAPAQK